MISALIAGLIKTLAIYLILAICYLIFFICMRKSNIINKSQLSSFTKYVVVMHSIYFIPITILNMLNALEEHIVVLICAIILILMLYPISKLVLKYQSRK